MKTRLYLPEKYGVCLGKGVSSGLCTVWGDPELVLKECPGLMDKVAVMGTLYSREGVNIILRNLGLNPSICRLYVWGWSPLSKLKFGKTGWSVLEALWKNGVSDDGVVKGADFKLHDEFEIDKVRKIVNRVELVDISGVKMGDLTGRVDDVSEAGTGEVFDFVEHKPQEEDTWPSELVGWSVRGEKITDAWIKVVDRIMRYGVVKETEYGNRQRELVGMSWVVTGEDTSDPYIPNWPDKIKLVLQVNKKSLEEYYHEFMSSRLPPGTAYTYGSRIWDFKRRKGVKGVNQISQIIDHLNSSAVTRRAVVSTWNIGLDGDKTTKNPPCFVACQFIQTNGQLHILALFRSHDIYKAAIPNAFALRRLQEHVAKETGFEVGDLMITSNSAHVYEEDWDDALKLVECQVRKGSMKMVHDPRGSVLIGLREGRIVAEMVNGEGSGLYKISGKTAKEVAGKLGQLELLSQSIHWLDIGMELFKAEVCLRLKKEYRQDKEIVV
jgi:thymidylate synthase